MLLYTVHSNLEPEAAQGASGRLEHDGIKVNSRHCQHTAAHDGYYQEEKCCCQACEDAVFPCAWHCSCCWRSVRLQCRARIWGPANIARSAGEWPYLTAHMQTRGDVEQQGGCHMHIEEADDSKLCFILKLKLVQRGQQSRHQLQTCMHLFCRA